MKIYEATSNINIEMLQRVHTNIIRHIETYIAEEDYIESYLL